MKKWIDLRYYYAQKTNQSNGRGWDFRPQPRRDVNRLFGAWFK